MCCRGCNLCSAFGECLGIVVRTVLLCDCTSPSDVDTELYSEEAGEYSAVDTAQRRFELRTRRIAVKALVITTIGMVASLIALGLQSFIIYENNDNSEKIDKLVDHFGL